MVTGELSFGFGSVFVSIIAETIMMHPHQFGAIIISVCVYIIYVVKMYVGVKRVW